MKRIKYTLGIIAIVVTFSSCTVEELALATAAGVAVTGQTPDNNAQTTDNNTQTTATVTPVTSIDPPVIPTKP